MRIRRFKSFQDMTHQIVELLTRHTTAESPTPNGVMLSGGLTPLPAYRMLARQTVRAHASTHILFSDERMVPANSPENNYGNTVDLINTLGVPPPRVLHVHTNLTLSDAADRYDRDLQAFFQKGGSVGLGLLGLGTDGHTASIFTAEDVERGRGRLAMAVPRPTGGNRVTITADLLARIRIIYFLAAGPDKSEIVKRLIDSPESLPAGLAVAGAPEVHLWVS